MNNNKKSNTFNDLTGGIGYYYLEFKNNISLAGIGVSLFTIFVLMHRWFDANESITRFHEFGLVSLALILLIIGVADKQFFRNKISTIDILWAPAIAIISGYIIFTKMEYFTLFYYTAGFSFLILTKISITETRIAFLLIKVMAVLFALGSITQFIYPEIFNEFALKIGTSYALEDIENILRRNYHPGFAFTQPAQAAGYMVVGLGLILTFWENKKVQVISDGILFMLLLSGLLLTGKRSIFIWAVFALPFTYVILSVGKEKFKRAGKAIAAVMVSAAIIMTALHLSDAQAFIPRLESLISELLAFEITGSVAVRFMLYQDAWATFLENPLFGIGWEQFQANHPIGYSPHSVYLQLLAEMGILGFTAVMVPLVYTYITTYKTIKSVFTRTEIIDPLWEKALSFSFYYQTFFLLYSISENTLYHLFYILMYFFSVALVNAYIVLSNNGLINISAYSGRQVP